MSEESKEQTNNPTEGSKAPDISKILEQIDSEQEKRKAAEAELKAVADTLKNEVPEEYRELVPNLPPGLRSSPFYVHPDREIDVIVMGAGHHGHPGTLALDGPAPGVAIDAGCVVLI